MEISGQEDTTSHRVTIACPLCGGRRYRELAIIKGFHLVRCRKCTLVFVNPQLTSDELARVYTDKDDPDELINLYARLATPGVLNGYDLKLQMLEDVLGRRGRLLDFACAAGYFCERASHRGWEAHGVDIGPWVRMATTRRGLQNIHIGRLGDLNLPEHYFDVIYAAQVLEHLQDPLSALGELRRLLTPKGMLYVDVPNFRTLPIMFGKDDFYLNSPPQHINFFTPHTLTCLLQKAGFRIEKLYSEGGLKWENLIGRPIVSEIADAYRANLTSPTPTDPERARTQDRREGVWIRALRNYIYRQLKLGINLAALARPRGPTPLTIVE